MISVCLRWSSCRWNFKRVNVKNWIQCVKFEFQNMLKIMFSVSFLHSYYQTKLPYIYRPIVSVCVCVYVCACMYVRTSQCFISFNVSVSFLVLCLKLWLSTECHLNVFIYAPVHYWFLSTLHLFDIFLYSYIV